MLMHYFQFRLSYKPEIERVPICLACSDLPLNPFAPDVAYKQHHFQSQFSSPSIKLSDIFWYRWNSNFLGFLMIPYLLISYARSLRYRNEKLGKTIFFQNLSLVLKITRVNLR